MVQVDQIYQLVQLVTDLFPVFVIFSLIGLFFYLLAKMIGGKSKLGEKFDLSKKFLYPMFGILMMLAMAFSVGPGGASVNAVGITIDSNVIFGGSVATVKASGLTVDTEYTIWATNNAATFTNVTFTASSATMYVPIPIPAESDSAFTLNIAASTAGVAAAATASFYVSLTDPTGFLPTDLFLSLLVPIILILIIVGVVISIKGGMGGKNS